MKLLWPNSEIEDLDLQWLVDNQADIVKTWPAGRTMDRTRPLKLWADGRVRIEFVSTFKSASDARRLCEIRLAKNNHLLNPPTDKPTERRRRCTRHY